MKKLVVLTILLTSIGLSGCSNWISGNKILADKEVTDQQIKSKIIDNKTSITEVNELFGDKKQESRSVIKKSFPNGVFDIASYQGHLNGFGGTYAHRILFIAFNKNGVVINHDIAINDFRNKNKFEEDPEKKRLVAFNTLSKGDSDSKVLNLLGSPRLLSFSDSGNVLWIYSNTQISRDASSYIPIYNMLNGTESGTSERVYIELKEGKVENVYLISMNIAQGRGSVNAWDYKEDITSINKKYKE